MRGDSVNLRMYTEMLEEQSLSPYACKSRDTKGRREPRPLCDIRTEFQRDRDKITHSKAFRRLMHKTQVFISPEGDHYRTRLTHTLEVAQISRTIARALRLNEDLTEAIALGHDLGHTPFGHTGEHALNSILPGGFRHNEQSLRVVDVLEKDGKGLNLTEEVRDGILNHRTSGSPQTLEGRIVQLSDKIAYINHDIDDALRAGALRQEDIPADCRMILGDSSKDRIDFLIRSVIKTSQGKDNIEMDPAAMGSMRKLRSFMFDTVYAGSLQAKDRSKIRHMLENIYEYYMSKPEELPGFKGKDDDEELPRTICDFIAGMTDRYAIKLYGKLFLPSTWSGY